MSGAPEQDGQGAAFTLGNDGYFYRDGLRFIPVGANYWPGSCGVEMWQRWPREEIRADLQLLAGLGLNTVRFFIRWQDFEPRAGEYPPEMFERLAEMLQLCRETGVLAMPSLFVGWMSGGLFWPEWFDGRNPFADAELTARAELLAQRLAMVLAGFSDVIVAVDQGNELCCTPEAPAAPPAAVRAWCGRVNAAVRAAFPGVLLVSGNEQNQLTSDTGWRLGQQPGVDFYSMHGYPVPAWFPIAFDGMKDAFTQTLLPTCAAAARAFGPVMVQEFGTIVTFGRDQQDAYLRAALPACWDAGANGFLWWCLRDITAKTHPYTITGFEGTLGLVDADGCVKPGLEAFLEFAQGVGARAAVDPGEKPVGVYLSQEYYPRDNPACPGHTPADQFRGLVLGAYFLRQLGKGAPCVARGGAALDPRLKTLLAAGLHLLPEEAARLEEWVRAGGLLVWIGPDPVNWGPDYIRLIGAEPVDYRAARPVEALIGGETYRLEDWPRNLRVEARPREARVLARDAQGLPVVLEHSVGKGRVRVALPALEQTIARVSGDPRARDAWLPVFRLLFED